MGNYKMVGLLNCRPKGVDFIRPVFLTGGACFPKAQCLDSFPRVETIARLRHPLPHPFGSFAQVPGGETIGAGGWPEMMTMFMLKTLDKLTVVNFTISLFDRGQL